MLNIKRFYWQVKISFLSGYDIDNSIKYLDFPGKRRAKIAPDHF
jgi:hypothetical protein